MNLKRAKKIKEMINLFKAASDEEDRKELKTQLIIYMDGYCDAIIDED